MPRDWEPNQFHQRIELERRKRAALSGLQGWPVSPSSHPPFFSRGLGARFFTWRVCRDQISRIRNSYEFLSRWRSGGKTTGASSGGHASYGLAAQVAGDDLPMVLQLSKLTFGCRPATQPSPHGRTGEERKRTCAESLMPPLLLPVVWAGLGGLLHCEMTSSSFVL